MIGIEARAREIGELISMIPEMPALARSGCCNAYVALAKVEPWGSSTSGVLWFRELGLVQVATNERGGSDGNTAARLLKELAELRELDRRRQAQAPGSPDHEAATVEVDRRNNRLMDWFRDLATNIRGRTAEEETDPRGDRRKASRGDLEPDARPPRGNPVARANLDD